MSMDVVYGRMKWSLHYCSLHFLSYIILVEKLPTKLLGC